MKTQGTAIASLGFGCMRLPLVSQDNPKLVDIGHLEKMVDAFMESGFNYFDTARTYHCGLGEGALKRTLVDRYPRDSFVLATKAPAYLVSNRETAERMFYTSLEDLRVDYVDRYLLHNLGGPRTEAYDAFGLWDFAEERRSEGLVDAVGFSFHGTATELDELLKAHPSIDFVQLQLNFADWNDGIVQSGRCYAVARKHGKPIVAMGPLKGGLLSGLAPTLPGGEGLMNRIVSAALRFATSLDGVDTVLSGMSSLAQMQDNIAIMQNARPLNDDERDMLKDIVSDMERVGAIPCTSCGYCLAACRAHVLIPQVIGTLNTETRYGSLERARESYLWTSGGPATACVKCHACENVCPQGIPIADLMAKAASRYETHVG